MSSELHRTRSACHLVQSNQKAYCDSQLHFNDFAAHSVIYAVGSPFTKDEHFYQSFGANESAFGAIRPQDSRLRRNLLAPLFSRRAILKFEHVIHDKVLQGQN